MAITITIESIRKDARVRAGDISPADFPEPVLETLIDDAIQKYSQHYPYIEVSYFLTVNGQQLYSISPDDVPGILRIKMVHWHGMGETGFDFLNNSTIPGVPGVNLALQPYSPISTLDPSLYELFLINREHLDRISNHTYKILNLTDIYLMPIPNKDDERVFFVYYSLHTLKTIPYSKYRLLMNLILAEIYDYTANVTRLGGTQVSDRGRIRGRSSEAISMMDKANRLRDETFELLSQQFLLDGGNSG